MDYEALGAKVLVIKIEEEKKPGVLIYQEKDKPFKAIVKSVGCTCKCKLKVGDTVLIGPGRGMPIKSDHSDLLLLFEEEILCKVGKW